MENFKRKNQENNWDSDKFRQKQVQISSCTFSARNFFLLNVAFSFTVLLNLSESDRFLLLFFLKSCFLLSLYSVMSQFHSICVMLNSLFVDTIFGLLKFPLKQNKIKPRSTKENNANKKKDNRRQNLKRVSKKQTKKKISNGTFFIIIIEKWCHLIRRLAARCFLFFFIFIMWFSYVRFPYVLIFSIFVLLNYFHSISFWHSYSYDYHIWFSIFCFVLFLKFCSINRINHTNRRGKKTQFNINKYSTIVL